MDYPRMLYRCPGIEPIHGGAYSTRIVEDLEAEDAALAEGWYLSTPEAKAADDAARAAAKAAADKEAQDKLYAEAIAAREADQAAPTRAELEAKALELGIKIDGRWSDRKLADLILATTEA